MGVVSTSGFYSGFATAVLALHGLFIVWWSLGPCWLAWPLRPRLHLASLTWALLVFLPWPCPLTVLEDWLEGSAGTTPNESGFLLHYLDKFVYPNLAPRLSMAAAIVVVANFSYYGRHILNRRSRKTTNWRPYGRYSDIGQGSVFSELGPEFSA